MQIYFIKTLDLSILICILLPQIIYLFLITFLIHKGTVKFFNETKGFGFVVDDESGQEIFLHVTGLNGVRVRENDRVEYEVVDGRKGLNAVNVKKI